MKRIKAHAPAAKPARAAKTAAPALPAKPAAPALEAQAAVRRGLPKVSAYALENIKAWSRHRAGSTRIHPFIKATIPPSVLPKGYKPSIAMDDAVNQALSWATNAWAIFDEGMTFLGYPYLAQLTQRAEYRRPSEIIATERTRQWIEFSSNDDENKGAADKIKVIEDELDRLNVKDVVKKLIENDGYFGRAHLFIDACDPDDRKELVTSIGNGRNAISKLKITKENPIKRLKMVEPVWCYPANYNANDPIKPNWYRPETWFCQAKEIHASRLIPYITREVPDMLKPAYAFGGLSLSQLMKPYVDNWIRTRQSVSDLIHSFSVSGLATDLTTLMGIGGDDLMRRIDAFNTLRDNSGAMIIDKETEEWFNVTVPLGSLDHLQAQAQEQQAAPCGIPLVKLFGITPSGLNATSEGEIRVFYDWIGASQEAYDRKPITRIVDFIQLSMFGEIDQTIVFKFKPLWSLDEKGKAEVRKIDADTDGVLIQSGVLDPAESRKRVATDADTPYANLDVDDVPEPPENEMDDGEISLKDNSETDKTEGFGSSKPTKGTKAAGAKGGKL